MHPATIRTLLAALAVLPMAALPAMAHEGKTPVHFVSETGTDTGDCADATAPCASIAYALRQTEKGDEVHVTGGRFDFDMDEPEEVIQLLSPVVPVKGSFDTAFSNQDIAASPTILEGVGPTEAPALPPGLDEEEREIGLGPAAHDDAEGDDPAVVVGHIAGRRVGDQQVPEVHLQRRRVARLERTPPLGVEVFDGVEEDLQHGWDMSSRSDPQLRQRHPRAR